MNRDVQKQNLAPERNVVAVAGRQTTSEALTSSSTGKQHEQQPIRPICANKNNNNSNFNNANTNNNNNNNAKPKNNFLSNLLESNSKNHKRQESDSKLTSNFTRGFRREHSDFFPSSKRHSVVLGERQSAFAHLVPHRSSAIYTKYNKCNSGEPILTDFVSRAYLENSPTTSCAVTTATTITTAANTTTTSTKPTTSSTNPITASASSNALDNKKSTDKNVTNNSRNLFFMGPRREKTESVISLRNSANRNLLFDQLQVKLFKPKTKQKKKTKKTYTQTPKAKSNIEKKINTNPIHANNCSSGQSFTS